MAWDGKIPFLDGKPLVYVASWEERQPGFQWRDNNSFQDVLQFDHFSRGRSAARAVFQSRMHNCPVEMFLTDLASDMKRMVDGRLEGIFQFCKRGQNFGIQRVA